MESDLTQRRSGGPGGRGRRPGRDLSPGSGKSPARCKDQRLPDSPPLSGHKNTERVRETEDMRGGMEGEKRG